MLMVCCIHFPLDVCNAQISDLGGHPVELALSRKISYSILATLLLLLATEGVLRLTLKRIAQATIPSDQVEQHCANNKLAYDPELGWVFPPLDNPSDEITPDGFRRPELVTLPKPPGTWRAITLGDSQTFGAGVASAESYPAVTERLLRQAQGQTRHIEVLNAAISGYKSLQILRKMAKLMKYEPDLYIVDAAPFDSIRDDYVPSPSPWVAKAQRYLFHVRLYYVLRVVLEKIRPSRPAGMNSANAPKVAEGTLFGNHDLIMEFSKEQDVPVIFLDYPFWVPEPDQIKQLLHQDELPPGAVLVPVTTALKESGHPNNKLFLDNNHATALGNEIIGQTLATLIQQQPWGP